MFEPKWQQHLDAAQRAGRESACGKKIDYKSEASAERASVGMNKKKAAQNDPKLLEPCPFCNGWHVGGMLVAR